jgi:hypothetical protein
MNSDEPVHGKFIQIRKKGQTNRRKMRRVVDQAIPMQKLSNSRDIGASNHGFSRIASVCFRSEPRLLIHMLDDQGQT